MVWFVLFGDALRQTSEQYNDALVYIYIYIICIYLSWKESGNEPSLE
jgi:hypothetical protein